MCLLTNVPSYWKKIEVVKSLVISDHDMVITYPRDTLKANRTNSYFRDVREHRKLTMLRELESLDWNMIISNIQNLDEMNLKFYETSWTKFDKSFPLINVNVYFQSVNIDPYYNNPKPIQISDGTRIPLLSIHTFKHHLLNQKRPSAGPDSLPYWFWKCFATELAPILRKYSACH